MSALRVFFTLGVAAVLCSSPRGARAQPAAPAMAADEQTRNAARELARDAVAAHDAGNHAKALDLINRAFKLVPAPSVSVWQARILAKMGRLIEANERYEITRRWALPADAPDAFRAAVKEANDEVEILRERIPRLKVSVTGKGSDSPSLRVTLDGRPVPPELIGVARTIDPGVHRLEARVPGHGSAREQVEIAERGRKDVVLRLAPGDTGSEGIEDGAKSDRGAWSARKTWSLVAAGVGVAGVGAGIGFGLAAKSESSKLEEVCDGNRCPPSAQDDLDSYRSHRTVSWIGYGVGAAGLATAAVLLFIVRDEPKRAAIAPVVGLGSAGLAGRF